jgi:chromosome segregation ATPase
MTKQFPFEVRPSHARRLAVCRLPALLVAASIGLVSGQTQQPAEAAAPPVTPAAAPTSPPAAPATSQTASSSEDDRFPGLRENADRLKAVYEKVDEANMNEVERLLKTRVCQINRIGGDLDRTIGALQDWIQAELVYNQKWAEVEQLRVDGQRKSLAGMELDQQRAKELIETETRDREELLRRKATLEQYGKRTQEIIKDIDALVLDIKDSEDRLTKAQKQYDDITAQVNNMNASITARLIDMRQQINRIQAYGLQLTAFYEDKRKDAQEVCNTKQPGASRTPLPKKRTTQTQP